MQNKYVYKTLHVLSGQFVYLTHFNTKQQLFEFPSKTTWKRSLIDSIDGYNSKIVSGVPMEDQTLSYGALVSVKEFEMVRVKVEK